MRCPALQALVENPCMCALVVQLSESASPAILFSAVQADSPCAADADDGRLLSTSWPNRSLHMGSRGESSLREPRSSIEMANGAALAGGTVRWKKSDEPLCWKTDERGTNYG